MNGRNKVSPGTEIKSYSERGMPDKLFSNAYKINNYASNGLKFCMQVLKRAV